MSRAKEIAYEYAKEHGTLGHDYNQIYDAVKYGYEQAINDITMFVIGEKIKQGVNINNLPQKTDISSINNAVNENCKDLSEGEKHKVW